MLRVLVGLQISLPFCRKIATPSSTLFSVTSSITLQDDLNGMHLMRENHPAHYAPSCNP